MKRQMEDFGYFERWVMKNLNIDLSFYKPKQMQRRILSKMRGCGAKNLREYADMISVDEKVRRAFIDHITINVTEFFRNRERFEAFQKGMMRQHPLDQPLLVWSAACSNGAEAYSISFLLRDSGFNDVQILATDIDDHMLRKAKRGQYTEMELKGLDPKEKKKFFYSSNKDWVVKDKYQEGMRFSRHDLVLDPFPKGFDAIVCRNVLIYFTEAAKKRIFQEFYRSLNPSGILFIGATESIYGYTHMGFRRLDSCIYVKE